MNEELQWSARIERVETLRQEAAQRHLIHQWRLAHQAVRVNLWARLLPLLRRLEAWMERHAKPEASTYKASAQLP